MPLPSLRSAAALAVGVVFPLLASTPFGPPVAGGRPPRPPAASAVNRHRCDRVAYVVGDSRRTLEHEVLPRTTDRVWARRLGISGGAAVDAMAHVRYLAEPGVVHERFGADLSALMATCSAAEHPLIFDFMGTNYGVQHPERATDPAFFREIRGTIAAFYADHAPKARVVLAELTFDRTSGDAATRAGIAGYLRSYNAVLRDLARSQPARFFFLPAPAIYDGQVSWRDAAHESAELALAEHLGTTEPGALDAAGLAVIDRAGTTCALANDDRFGLRRYSEGVTLGAYLERFHDSWAARAWLRAWVPPNARIPLARHTDRCTP
jgi:hypothetical protein